MLELAILGLLKERSMHGYQLSKQLTDALGGFWRVSYGSLYPSLRRLERDGSVERVFSDEEVGRRKNVYRITSKGEDHFQELLQETGTESSEDNKFRVRLAFFKYLGPEMRIKLLERRRAFLQERLATIEASIARQNGSTGDAYTLSMMNHSQDATQSDIAWLDDLISAERRQVTTTSPKRATRSAREPRKTREPGAAHSNGTNGTTRKNGAKTSKTTTKVAKVARPKTRTQTAAVRKEPTV